MFIINDTYWNLVFCNPRSNNLRTSEGDYVLGMCDNNVKTVYVADNLTDSKTEHVICHELTHCVCFEYGISIPIETEEWLCNFMADYGKEIIYVLEDLLLAISRKVA